ncbi:hypothetical protein [Methylovirgula sp. 4M-Z18]|uniref:hypothetical protein n=1 Tax=Methylovirgula sp. 4M-Z18 TaxID=2293567 RepID=UPI000E2E923A|nr:hypothetical protein [Methylovirgula sp. 4M-Z18]RFB81238.1 hypothetical protein DYH55_07300 [Methylovirgula sp. 4M-Z18]
MANKPQSEIICRRALDADFAPAANLLNRYHFSRLSPEERRDGFISVRFTPDELRELTKDIGMFVAVAETNMLGCLCCSDVGSHSLTPTPFHTMRENFDRWSFHGKPLSQWRAFAYGPVCIEAAARGQGLLRRLFATMLPAVRNRFDIGTSFIAKSNERSLAAHVHQLGMIPIGTFRHNDWEFVVLAFDIA